MKIPSGYSLTAALEKLLEGLRSASFLSTPLEELTLVSTVRPTLSLDQPTPTSTSNLQVHIGQPCLMGHPSQDEKGGWPLVLFGRLPRRSAKRQHSVTEVISTETTSSPTLLQQRSPPPQSQSLSHSRLELRSRQARSSLWMRRP